MNNYRLPIIVLLIAILSLPACRPKGILSSRQMRQVIIDLHKTEALLDETGISRYNSEARSLYYAQVLERHETTQAQFDSSLVWYTAHPQLFDKIYPKVLASLDQEMEAYRSAHPEIEPTPFTPDQPEPVQETRPFTVSDLDSVMWVTLHGYGSSWNPYRKPFSMQDLIQ